MELRTLLLLLLLLLVYLRTISNDYLYTSGTFIFYYMYVSEKASLLVNPRAHHAIAQAASHQLLTTETWVHCQACLCVICGGQGSKVFCHVLQAFSVNITPPIFHTHSCIMWRMDKGSVSGISSTDSQSHPIANIKKKATVYQNSPYLRKIY
jgi:hypothetical protein